MKKCRKEKVLIKFFFPLFPPFIVIPLIYEILIGTQLVSPRCKPGTEQMSIGALNMQSLAVKCEVDADPSDHVKFAWTYNNTRNVSPVSEKKTFFMV